MSLETGMDEGRIQSGNQGIGTGGLNGFSHLAATETASAYPNPFDRSFFHDPDALKIRVELARAHVVSVGNRVAEHRGFSAYVTLSRHRLFQLKKDGDHSSPRTPSQPESSERPGRMVGLPKSDRFRELPTPGTLL